MKTFTQRAIGARNFTQAEDYNAEGNAIAGEFNGSIGGQQLPYDSVPAAAFSLGDNLDGTIETTPAGASTGLGQRKPTQTYAITQTAISDFAGFDFPDTTGLTSNNILGPPSKTYVTNGSEWGPGWNRFSAYIDKGVFLKLPCKTGILKGNAIVDFEFYYGEKSIYGLASGLAGGNWRWQVGVFVDGVLVAATGKMPPRRHTVCLPFAHPVPTRSIEIDVRWLANYDGAGSAQDYAFVADTVLRSYNHTLWVRNQYR